MASTRVKINGRWVDVPDRPNGVRASIRRNNGGKTIAETTASTDKSFMPYDERYPGAFKFLLDARWIPSREQRKAAVGALEGAGGSATLTGKGATGMVVKGAPQSPMAGARDTRGLAWDVIRARIHERATDTVLDSRWMVDEAPKVDMASEESKKNVLGQFDKAVVAEKNRLAGQFVDNLTKSIRDNVEKNWKPTRSSAAATAPDGTVKKPNDGLDGASRALEPENQWNGPAAAVADAAKGVKTQTAEVKDLTNKLRAYNQETGAWLDNVKKDREDTEKWMKDFAKQHGLKDPTQSAAKGGSAHSLPVSRSEDRFLDDLIGEMEV